MKDRYLLKAFLIIGPHGSGKSYIIENMFSKYEIRSVKSDFYFKRNLTNYAKNFNLHQIIRHINDVKQRILEEQDEEAQIKSAYWLDTMSPIVLELTGNSEEVIYQNTSLLSKLAYDISFIYVDTPLEMALDRNNFRVEPLPENIIKKAWAEVNINMSAFEKKFRHKFYRIHNNVDYKDKPEEERLFHFNLRDQAREIMNKPHTYENSEVMLDLMKGLGLKYRSQLDPLLPELIAEPQE